MTRDLLTVDEAADRLGISRSTLVRWIRSGAPFVVKVAGRTRISVPRLERYLHGQDASA